LHDNKAVSFVAQTDRLPRENGARRTTITLSLAAVEFLHYFKYATGLSTSAAINQMILRTRPRKSCLVKMSGLLVLDVKLKRQLTPAKIKELSEDQPRGLFQDLKPTPRRVTVSISQEADEALRSTLKPVKISLGQQVSKLIEDWEPTPRHFNSVDGPRKQSRGENTRLFQE
jgi:hypothetical protein